LTGEKPQEDNRPHAEQHAAGEEGRDAEAQAEAAEVLRVNPNWSLEVWRQRVPYKDPAMLERVFAALRKAGLK
jgi:hypothetical protein